MADDQLTLPLSDDDLIRLARHRYEQADRDGATEEDFRQLCDIFPAVLQRLQDKVEATRDIVEIQHIDLRHPESWRHLMSEPAE